MHKKISFIAIILFSFAVTACSSSKNEVSVTSASQSSASIIEKEVSISASLSSASSSSTISSVSEDDDDPGVEAEPVEDDDDETNASINNAFSEDYDVIEGNYVDEKNDKIDMSIESFGCEAQILVSWPKEDNISYEWEMTASIVEGKLTYSNCTCMKINSTNPNDPDYEIEYLDGSGYFEIKDNKLIWIGAEEESCKSLSFVKK